MEKLSKSEYKKERDRLRRECLVSIDGFEISSDEEDFVDAVFTYIEQTESYRNFIEFATEYSVSVLKYEDDPYYAQERRGERTLDLLMFEAKCTISDIVKRDIESFLFENPELLGCRMRNRKEVCSVIPNLASSDNTITPYDVDRMQQEARKNAKMELLREAFERDDIDAKHPSVAFDSQPQEARNFVNSQIDKLLEDEYYSEIPEPDIDRPDGEVVAKIEY
jgi:hypothetical protein